MSAPKKQEVGRAFKIPSFVEDQAPVARSENRADYLAMMLSVAQHIMPATYLEWLFVKDFVDALWEVNRYRKTKTGLLELALRDEIETVLKEAQAYEPDAFARTVEILNGAKGKAMSWSHDSESRRRVEDELIKLGHSLDEVFTRAVVAIRRTLDELDRLLSTAETRRDEAIKNLEKIAGVLARRAEQVASKIVDADFVEVSQVVVTNTE